VKPKERVCIERDGMDRVERGGGGEVVTTWSGLALNWWLIGGRITRGREYYISCKSWLSLLPCDTCLSHRPYIHNCDEHE
jgi:hypothetical protein